MQPPTIAVIGGGFSGAMAALELLRQTPPPTRIVLIERAAPFGLGQAYVTANPNHLLNVPASRMSVSGERPGEFLDWLRAQPGAPRDDGFVPRPWFGAYMRSVLDRAAREAPDRLQLVSGDAVRLRDGRTLNVELADGRFFNADMVVLALGNFVPPPLLAGGGVLSESRYYRANPWAPDATLGVPADAPVLLIGTGLTMVDVVVTLLDAGHRGPIHALSRTGQVPHRHVALPPGPMPPVPDYPATLVALLRCVRTDAAACEALGAWQCAIERFRPFVQHAWEAADPAERLRFLRHLRSWWAIHRHRIAGPVADRIDSARARSQLLVKAGRVAEAAEDEDGLAVGYTPRGGLTRQTIRAARVINCTGPASDYRRITDPLVQGLLQDGLVRPDPWRMGLDVTAGSAVLGADGTALQTLFAVGPVTRGVFWEVIAVPDIRAQCETLASQIAEQLRTELLVG